MQLLTLGRWPPHQTGGGEAPQSKAEAKVSVKNPSQQGAWGLRLFPVDEAEAVTVGNE